MSGGVCTGSACGSAAASGANYLRFIPRKSARLIAKTLRSAIASMAHGGRIAQLGIPTGDVSLDLNEIVFKMLTLRGIYGREMYETWYKMTVMVQSGLDIRPAITHRFSFRDHEAAFAAARSGDSGKVIMDWTK